MSIKAMHLFQKQAMFLALCFIHQVDIDLAFNGGSNFKIVQLSDVSPIITFNYLNILLCIIILLIFGFVQICED